MSQHTLVLVRHAKSDWDAAVGDRERPLSKRGRRQAPESGVWLALTVPSIELAVVSPATRARQTWELVAAELDRSVRVRVDEDAYTFDATALGRVVASLPDEFGTVALVGHNPAMEELVTALTGQSVRMPTSAVAIIDLPRWDATGTLRWAGRPADLDWSTHPGR